MATTLVSVEEYLNTSTSPDCEYVRGVIKYRPAAELDHAAWHAALLRYFADRSSAWNTRAYPSVRIMVAADNFRVPDVTILSRSAPREQIVSHPPLAVFEILSPEDSMTGILEKLADYLQMGIPAIWVINPEERPKKPSSISTPAANSPPPPSSNSPAAASAYR